MTNAKLLSVLSVNPAKTAGWYVRAEWMDSGKYDDRTRVEVRVGPFAEKWAAVAFNMLVHPEGVPSRYEWHGIEELDDYIATYYDELAGEMRGVKEVRLILPAAARLNRKGWGETKLPRALEFCVEEAKKLVAK